MRRQPRAIVRTLRSAACAALLLAAAPTAAAQTLTITFEDTVGNALEPLGQYAGFGWHFADASLANDIAAVDVPAWLPANLPGWYAGVGCPPSALPGSGCTGAYNMFSASPGAISRAEPFILERLDLTSSLGAQTVELVGYRNGALLASRSLALSELRQTVVLGWAGIDEIRLVSAPGANQWVLDNLQYTLPVPEPATLAQLAAGLAVLLLARRHRRPS